MHVLCIYEFGVASKCRLGCSYKLTCRKHILTDINLHFEAYK